MLNFKEKKSVKHKSKTFSYNNLTTQSCFRIKPIFFSPLCNFWGDVEMLNFLVHDSFSWNILTPHILSLFLYNKNFGYMKTCKEVLRRQTTLSVRASLVKPPWRQLFGFSYICSRDKLGPDISRTFSVSVQCSLGVMVSIRSECFAVDKIINKFHKVSFPIIYMIKIYCWYWWCVIMYKILRARSSYHLELFIKSQIFIKPLDTILWIFHSLLCFFLSLSCPKFLLSESG